jgi:hypothetical protein
VGLYPVGFSKQFCISLTALMHCMLGGVRQQRRPLHPLFGIACATAMASGFKRYGHCPLTWFPYHPCCCSGAGAGGTGHTRGGAGCSACVGGGGCGGTWYASSSTTNTDTFTTSTATTSSSSSSSSSRGQRECRFRRGRSWALGCP